MFFEYRVALFGHRDLLSYRKIEERLHTVLDDLFRATEYVNFHIGRNGDFDIISASVIKQHRKAIGNENCVLTLVLPYMQSNIEDYEKYYDDVIIPDSLTKIYPKRAITERNKWIVENCDMLICFVEKKSGGAYNALKYAEKLGKRIINLADDAYFDNDLLPTFIF